MKDQLKIVRSVYKTEFESGNSSKVLDPASGNTIHTGPESMFNKHGKLPSDMDANVYKIYDQNLEEKAKWRKGTTLIAGDSLLFGIDEKRLRNTKVRIFPGSSIEDAYFHLYPLLRKCPTNILLLFGTNNAREDTSFQIREKLMKLKAYISSILPNCTIYLSTLITRLDDAKAQVTVQRVNDLLKKMDIPLINNDNITAEYLGKKQLHLNQRGVGKLALNFVKTLNKL